MRAITACGLVLFVACGGAESNDRMGNLALSNLQAPGTQPTAIPTSPTTPLTFADGTSLVGIDALTRFESDPVEEQTEQVCAVYSLRATNGGLKEGRGQVPCPAREAEFSSLPIEQLEDVEPARADELQRALRGARLGREAGDDPAVLLRVTTNEGTIEATVSSVRWPHPDMPEPSAERPPENLAELWEAVLHPQRYAAR